MHIGDVHRPDMLLLMTRTMLDLDDDLLARAAKHLGTTTKKDTVHAALRAALRTSAAHSLLERMAENTAGTADEALVNEMWQSRQPNQQ
jgi:Arc/MetJ family transcription regulator